MVVIVHEAPANLGLGNGVHNLTFASKEALALEP